MDRRTLNCARFFAAAALIFYFLTSCTNYWLQAITCPLVNDTLEKMQEELQDNPLETSNATGQKSGILSPMSTDILNGSVKSSGLTPSKARGGENYEYQRDKRSSIFTYTLLSLDILKGSVKSSGLTPSKARGGENYENQRDKRSSIFTYTLLSLKDSMLIFHHEGFFWSCSFVDKEGENQHSKFIYFYQPPTKCCTRAFQSPFPSKEEKTFAEFQSNLVYYQLWGALMFFGVIFITIGFLCIIHKACCSNCCKYKAIGAIFLMAGLSFFISIIMYVYWMSAVYQMIAKEIAVCNSIGNKVNYGVNYGWSFIAAPFGILFSFIAGFLFIKFSGTDDKESEGMI